VNPAIVFEPDGYLPKDGWLMGRQSAGAGFLRAAVLGRGDGPVTAFTPFRASAAAFQKAVAQIDPQARAEWISAQRLDLLAQKGLLYRPDLVLGPAARQRLRVGPAAYSLCGVTHTLSSHGSLDAIAKILSEPVMPWDALVCTSQVALSVVTAVLDHEAEYLAWRTGAPPTTRPMLPVIPLGVHAADFAGTAQRREGARARLGLAADEVAFLSAGRLSLAGKAHPYATFTALQAAAEETGKPLVLLFAGQARYSSTLEQFREGAATFCPSVRTVFVEGKDDARYQDAWAGADVFISLADSIQETFGLTPLEAMASGLPALVSDWDGYKDTVRDGLDGFRIATWAPEPGGGATIAHDYEIGLSNYDEYLYQSTAAVALDLGQLKARLHDLIEDPDLRRRLGASGRERARSTFDWAHVYRSYQALWAEQTARRQAGANAPDTAAWLSAAPTRGPDHLGPFDTFAGYPTHHVTAASIVSLAAALPTPDYEALIRIPVLTYWAVAPAVHDRIREALADGPLTVAALAGRTTIPEPSMIEVAARLAKIGVLAVAEPAQRK